MLEVNQKSGTIARRTLSIPTQGNRVTIFGDTTALKPNQKIVVSGDDNVLPGTFIYLESNTAYLASPLHSDAKPATHISLTAGDTDENIICQKYGDIDIFDSLVIGNNVWLSINGGITYTPQSEPTTTADMIQYLGRVSSSTTIELDIQKPIKLNAEII